MRVRVDLPINRPLRRGGNIVNPEGEKFWVTFKYERLPTFCFLRGILGHDEKHCPGNSNTLKAHRQYGDRLWANGGPKNGSERSKTSSSSGFEEHREGGFVDWQTLMASDSMDTEAKPTGFPMAIQNPTHLKNTQPRLVGVSVTPLVKQSTSNPAKGGQVSLLSLTPLSDKSSNNPQKIFAVRNEVCDESSIMGLPKQSPSKTHEIISPLKQNKEPHINNETITDPQSPRKGNWKRIARAQGKQTQSINSDTQNLVGLSGSKRINRLDFLEENEDEGKSLKKHYDSHHSNTHDIIERSVVAAKQHRREP